MIRRSSVHVYLRKQVKYLLSKEWQRRRANNEELSLAQAINEMLLEFLIIRDLAEADPDLRYQIAQKKIEWSLKNDM